MPIVAPGPGALESARSVLNAAFDGALQDKAMHKKLTDMGFEVVGGKPEVLSKLRA